MLSGNDVKQNNIIMHTHINYAVRYTSYICKKNLCEKSMFLDELLRRTKLENKIKSCKAKNDCIYILQYFTKG